MSFVSDKIGYGYYDASLWKTVDGGLNWTKINDVGYVELSFPTENIGYGQTTGGTYKTTDGGVTWSLVKISHMIISISQQLV